VHQVHGARVVLASDAIDVAGRPREEADAIVADAESGVHAVGVRVADCVPILVGDRRVGAVAAIHAGWRGIVAGVVGAAIAELGKFASKDYVAAIGPCIEACCFEVGIDVAEAIARAAGDALVVVARDGEKARVDLRRAVHAQLAKAHVHDVEDVPGCTKCDASRFFSYRRDGEASGRHIAVIAARVSAPLSV
jgi:YfiH family protein